MAVVSRSMLVPYTPHEMYTLVDDIDAYPRFLPWCKDARVLSRDEDEVHATIELARGGLHKAFTTCNRLQKDKIIEMRLVEGPFRHLEGFWHFDSLGEAGCKVSLNLEFEFSSRVLMMTVGPVFHQVANSLVDSFYSRAVEIFGKR